MAHRLDPLSELKSALKGAQSCEAHPPIARTTSPEQAALFYGAFQYCAESQRIEHLRWLGRNDLFFLGVYLLHRTHWIGQNPRQKTLTPAHRRKITQWYFDRCEEVQLDPDNNCDVWAREHAKSEIITFALTIEDILRDPNETFGIFSHNRPMAKQFLRLIKTEFEVNEELKILYPDILYPDPQRESPKWSVDDGIIVRRTSNTKESTIEAWGLVDGQPTSKRFSKLVYDDVVARDQISEQMIRRTTEELHNSYALTASDPPIRRIIGTPQEIGDTICDFMENGPFKVRVHPAIDDTGQPVFFSEAKLADFKNTMSPKVFALQFLLDPKKARDNHQVGFDDAWFQTYRTPRNIKSLNRYILIDPAGSKSKDSNSYFAAWVVGLCSDKHYYILDGVLDHLGLVQRSDLIFKLVRQWEPLKVVYEKFAFQSDIEHLHDKMDQDNFRFVIVPVAGGQLSKDQRIERLMPDFRTGLIVFPERLMYQTSEGKEIDLIKRFRDIEYSRFPFNPKFRDQLDALSRLKDEAEVNYVWPRAYGTAESTAEGWHDGSVESGGWMSQ
jgi:hypothetical protein